MAHKKRHHHERMEERAEHRRTKMHDGHYAGMDPRRRQEMEDAGMIHEDHHAIANMPQGVIIREYARENDYVPEELDDTIGGIERQKGMDHNRLKHGFAPKKV